MDDLRNAMRVIDENSNKLSEGDYLQLCNLLRNVYRYEERKEMNNLFDYRTFNMFVPGESEEERDYFYSHYYQTSLDNELMFMKSQRHYLESEIEIHRPIQRISKNVKLDAIKQYCGINDIRLGQYTIERFKEYHIINRLFVSDKIFENGLRNICKTFIHMENKYRNLYCGVIMERIEKIEGWLDTIEDM